MTAATCENCGTPLLGEYCHACGQRVHEGGELTVRHAAATVAGDVLHLESKTLRSLGLLLAPGLLTSRYLAGHRVPYTSPVKLYLLCAAIFFLCAPLAGFTLEAMLPTDSTGLLRELVGRAIAETGHSPDVFTERFNVRFQSVYTAGLLVSVVTGALALALLYRRQRRPFGAHIVFELHYVSFLYLFAIGLGVVLAPLGLTGTPVALAATLAVLLLFVFLALRRVYAEPAGTTLWKAVAMVAFAFVVDNIVNILTLVVTLKLV